MSDFLFCDQINSPLNAAAHGGHSNLFNLSQANSSSNISHFKLFTWNGNRGADCAFLTRLCSQRASEELGQGLLVVVTEVWRFCNLADERREYEITRDETSGRAPLMGFIVTLLADTIFARRWHKIDAISLCKHPVFGEKLLVGQTQAAKASYNHRIQGFFLSFLLFLRLILCRVCLNFRCPWG